MHDLDKGHRHRAESDDELQRRVSLDNRLDLNRQKGFEKPVTPNEHSPGR